MRVFVPVLALWLAPAAAAQAPPSAGWEWSQSPSNGLSSDTLVEANACKAKLQSIGDEKAASVRAFAKLKEPPTLKDQYEEDMYFANKRMKLIASACADTPGRKVVHEAARKSFEKSRSVCAIVAKDCKPAKHW